MALARWRNRQAGRERIPLSFSLNARPDQGERKSSGSNQCWGHDYGDVFTAFDWAREDQVYRDGCDSRHWDLAKSNRIKGYKIIRVLRARHSPEPD